jgi:lipid II:glycine glycyltransferase (peptidoglycan interpeptide bridge formation enzyme)
VFTDIYFQYAPPPVACDVISYIQLPEPVEGAVSMEKHTLAIDLQDCDPQAVFARFAKTTQYEIRRARERDKVNCQFPDWRSGLTAYATLQQDLSLSSRGAVDVSTLAQFGGKHALRISTARNHTDGKILAAHIYVSDGARIRLLHSASRNSHAADTQARNLAARANRLLHWEDITRFRSQGLRLYDFGGWYAGQTDHKLLSINQFKESFGGTKVREWNCLVAATPLGRYVLATQRFLRRLGTPRVWFSS